MRGEIMRGLIAAIDRGERAFDLSAEDLVRVDRDARWAKELEAKLRAVYMQFHAEHGDAGPQVGGPALLRAAALSLMAGLDMDPDNFAELARAVAKHSEQEAKQLRQRLLSTGQA